MSLLKIFRKVTRFFGVEVRIVTIKTSLHAKYKKILKDNDIDLVIDIGANVGQFAEEIYDTGYKGRVVSYEPIKQPFDLLAKKVKSRSNWEAYQFAVGDQKKTDFINVSSNVVSSSLLEIEQKHVMAAEESSYVRKEEISIDTLTNLFDIHDLRRSSKIYLKVDVQGFELPLLHGAEDVLHLVEFVQLEMSLEPLYKTSVDYKVLIAHMETKGFSLFQLIPGFTDMESGQLMQVDGLFKRK